MLIKRNDRNEVRVLACIGAMTLGGGADELGDVFARALGEGGRGIVLDLTRLSYLDSAGVGAVVTPIWRTRSRQRSTA